MSKVLVIPDVHLKPWMFEEASRLLRDCDFAVVLGDLVDDWDRQHDRDAYAETIEAAAAFDEAHPDTLWCYGNHDFCYLHFDEGTLNSGFSDTLKWFVRRRLQELESSVGERYKVVHDVDGVLFSHAGVSSSYVAQVRARLGGDISLPDVLEFTNELASASMLWLDDSPLWLRPSRGCGLEGILQVVGHTPVSSVTMRDGIAICDTFSLRPDGSVIGDCRFTVVDTVGRAFASVVIDE